MCPCRTCPCATVTWWPAIAAVKSCSDKAWGTYPHTSSAMEVGDFAEQAQGCCGIAAHLPLEPRVSEPLGWLRATLLGHGSSAHRSSGTTCPPQQHLASHTWQEMWLLFPFVDCLSREWFVFSVAASAQSCGKCFLLLLLLHGLKSRSVFQLVLLGEVLWDPVGSLTWTILIYGTILSCTRSHLHENVHLYCDPWTSRVVHAGCVRSRIFLA